LPDEFSISNVLLFVAVDVIPICLKVIYEAPCRSKVKAELDKVTEALFSAADWKVMVSTAEAPVMAVISICSEYVAVAILNITGPEIPGPLGVPPSSVAPAQPVG